MRAITSSVLLLAWLLAPPAAADALADYNRALAAFNEGRPLEAAPTFHQLATGADDPEVRRRAEYYLGRSLLKADLPFSAATHFSNVLEEGPEHPFALEAVEGLVEVQARVDDQALIPSRLNDRYDPQAWARLSPSVQGRINLMVARIARRQGKLEEARVFLEAIDDSHPVYPQAQYLLGVTLADPRFPGRGSETQDKSLNEKALAAFSRVMGLKDGKKYESLENTRALAALGLGRVHYAMGNFAEASRAYGRIPRETRYWDVALFEDGFARFRNEDPGGALGSLQSLYAPQFASAFQPESRILTATIYYFSCLYDESKRALEAQEEIYGPMHRALASLLAEDAQHPPAFFHRLVAEGDARVPAPIMTWLRGNARLAGAMENLRQLDREEARIAQTPALSTGGLGTALKEQLAENREVLVQVAGTLARDRLAEAKANIETFRDQANIIRFEISNAEKELAMEGIDQQAYLASQSIFRPAMPAPDYNYWRFQGEFWRDEIGAYRYTLKNGCALQRE